MSRTQSGAASALERGPSLPDAAAAPDDSRLADFLWTAISVAIVHAAIFLLPSLLLGLSHFHLASPGEIAMQVIHQGVPISGITIVGIGSAVSLPGASATTTTIIALVPAVASLFAISALV